MRRETRALERWRTAGAPPGRCRAGPHPGSQHAATARCSGRAGLSPAHCACCQRGGGHAAARRAWHGAVTDSGVPSTSARKGERGRPGQHLRQVPVVQGDVGLDARGQQRVDDPRVEGQAGLVHGAVPVREDARPRHRHAEAPGAQLLHHPDVLRVEAVEVVRHSPCARADPSQFSALLPPLPLLYSSALLSSSVPTAQARPAAIWIGALHALVMSSSPLVYLSRPRRSCRAWRQTRPRCWAPCRPWHWRPRSVPGQVHSLRCCAVLQTAQEGKIRHEKHLGRRCCKAKKEGRRLGAWGRRRGTCRTAHLAMSRHFIGAWMPHVLPV